MSVPVSKEQINKFVAAWYLALDQHVPCERIVDFVTDDGLQMIFPEKTLHGIGDFLAWYAGGTYSDGEQAPGVINIFFDENHNVVSVEPADDSAPAGAPAAAGAGAALRVVVAWQASVFNPPDAKSKRISSDFTQRWTVQRSTKNPYGLVIETYNAVSEPPVFAPGFARL